MIVFAFHFIFSDDTIEYEDCNCWLLGLPAVVEELIAIPDAEECMTEYVVFSLWSAIGFRISHFLVLVFL